MSNFETIKVVPARYPLRAVGAAVALFVLAVVIQSVAFNPRWEWAVFARWFFDPVILEGVGQTLLLTLIGTALSVVFGGMLALARLSSSWLLSSLAWAYIWLFRSLPLIVVLIILYNFSYLYDTLSLGVPFTGITWGSFETINVLGQFSTAVVGLTLVQSAYTAEIIRGGFLGVDHGQYEAAAALGLPAWRRTVRIILPQALRTILPSGFNEIISLAKGTAMVYVLAMPELFYTIQMIYNRTQEVIPLLMVGAAWYLAITTVLSAIQYGVERALARSERRSAVNQNRAARRTPSVTTTPAQELSMQASPEGHISITGVSKYFGRHKALDNVSLEIPPGSVTVILGPSGSGKSTLLRTINHLERVDEGFIQIDGDYIGYRRQGDKLYELKEKEILKQRVNVGYVFQNFNLFPHLTVLENLIEAPIAHKKLSKKEAVETAYSLLDVVGLRDKADAWSRHLSGGQQQRIAIARALALRPRVMLFDEPTSALDPELVGEVLDVIKKLARSGTTLVVVTHEIGFAREVADQVVFMVDGKIVEQGSSDEVLNRPSHARTRQFLSKVL